MKGDQARPFPLPWRKGTVVLLLGILIGCGSTTPPVAETPPPPVTVSQPIIRNVVDQDDYEGRIVAAEKVELRARVRGHLAKIHFEAGQLVKAGELLYEIDPRPYKTALDAAKAQEGAAAASLEFAKSEYARVQRLVATKAATAQERDLWIAKQDAARADQLRAKAGIEQAMLDLNYTRITAPISGKLSRTLVDVGNLVNAGGGDTLLTTLVSVDPMYVYFDVDERSLLRYRRNYRKNKEANGPELPIKELKIPVFVALEGEEGYPHKGVIDFADNRINPSTGTIQIRGVLSNARRIFEDGMRARIRVPIGDPHKALMVTERAIGTDQGRKYVYVVNDKNVVERRDVVLDRLIDGMQVIQKGLKPGEWVIVNGIQRVRDGVEVDPKRGPMPGLSNPGGKN